jgi:hypothetical protein
MKKKNTYQHFEESTERAPSGLAALSVLQLSQAIPVPYSLLFLQLYMYFKVSQEESGEGLKKEKADGGWRACIQVSHPRSW